MDQDHDQQAELPLAGAGERLRRAREDAGLSASDIAARTRIPERHVAALETGNYGALAARTYAVGFSRLYARAVGLDEAEITEAVRAELDAAPAEARTVPGTAYEPADPMRVADRGLAWTAAAAAFALVIAGYAFWRQFQVPAMDLPPLVSENAPSAAPSPAAAPAPAPAQGPVVFTATADGVWVKFYDATGTQLMQKEMAAGETYTVPADAQGPQVWTARPDALAITIGGAPVAPLADRQVTVKDVPVSAAALLARTAAQPVAVASSATAGATVAAAGPTQAAPAPRPRPAPMRRSPPASPNAEPANAAEPAPGAAAPAPAPESTVSE